MNDAKGMKLMEYGQASRACAEACLEVLPPDDLAAQWIAIYLEHTAALQARVEALDREKAAGEFWSGLVYPDGATAEQVQAELTDYRTFMSECAKVYDHITRGRISKVNTLAHAVIAVADEMFQDDLQEALSDEREAWELGEAGKSDA
jgi:hypothetical protein